MPKPVDFLTASGEELRDWFHSPDSPPHYHEALAMLRNRTALAVEAKVRGEQERDFDRRFTFANSHLIAERDALQRRAERAEWERDAAIKRADYLHAENQANRASLADAERKGGYEALTRLINLGGGRPVFALRSYRDQHYAPVSPPSEEVSVDGWTFRRTGDQWQCSRDNAFWHTSPTLALAMDYAGLGEYTALVAMAQERPK